MEGEEDKYTQHQHPSSLLASGIIKGKRKEVLERGSWEIQTELLQENFNLVRGEV